MPGNGKKTVARSLDDLGEALKQNGFHPEEVLEAAHVTAVEQSEANPEEKFPQSQEVPVSEKAADSDETPKTHTERYRSNLLWRVGRLPIEPDHTEKLVELVTNARRLAKLEDLQKEITRLEGIHGTLSQSEISSEQNTQKKENDLPLNSIEDDIRRRINLLSLGIGEKNAIKKQLEKGGIHQLREVSRQVYLLEQKLSGVKAKVDTQASEEQKTVVVPEKEVNTPPGPEKAPKQKKEKIDPASKAAESLRRELDIDKQDKPEAFSDVSKTMGALVEPVAVEPKLDQKADRLNLLHPDSFDARDQKGVRDDFKRRINALRFRKTDQKDQNDIQALNKLLGNAKSTEELDRFGNYLSGIETNKPAHPDAVGVTLGSEDTRDSKYEMHGGKMYIRQGRAVHEATPEEVLEYHKARALPLIKVGDSYGVKEGNKTRFATPEEIENFLALQNLPPIQPRAQGTVESGAKTDRFQEDFYEATGKTHQEFLQGLEARAKIRTNREQRITIENVYHGMRSKNVRNSTLERYESLYHEAGSNLEEILRDPRKEMMMGALLEAQDQTGLIERYALAKSDPSLWRYQDDLVMKAMLKEFDRRAAGVAILKNAMTKGDIATMVRDNPELMLFQNSVSGDRAHEILTNSLDLLVMKMPENEYRGFLDTVVANIDQRNDPRYKAITERARTAAQNEGASPEDMNWKTLDAHPELAKLIKAPKWWDRVLGKVNGDSAKNSEEMLEAIAYNRKVAGMLLAASVARDPLLKRRLIEESQGGSKVPETAADSLVSDREAQERNKALADELDPEKLVENLKKPEFQNKIMPGGGYAKASEFERQQAASNYYGKLGNDVILRRGVIGRMMHAIYGAARDSVVKQIAKQGAFKH